MIFPKSDRLSCFPFPLANRRRPTGDIGSHPPSTTPLNTFFYRFFIFFFRSADDETVRRKEADENLIKYKLQKYRPQTGFDDWVESSSTYKTLVAHCVAWMALPGIRGFEGGKEIYRKESSKDSNFMVKRDSHQDLGTFSEHWTRRPVASWVLQGRIIIHFYTPRRMKAC